MANRTPEEEQLLLDSLYQLEQRRKIPAYRGLEGVGNELKQMVQPRNLNPANDPLLRELGGHAQGAISAINQGIFDVGSAVYNMGAAPINWAGEAIGYNPGLSGENFMSNLPWDRGMSSYGNRPQARGQDQLIPQPSGGHVPYAESRLGKAMGAGGAPPGWQPNQQPPPQMVQRQKVVSPVEVQKVADKVIAGNDKDVSSQKELELDKPPLSKTALSGAFNLLDNASSDRSKKMMATMLKNSNPAAYEEFLKRNPELAGR